MYIQTKLVIFLGFQVASLVYILSVRPFESIQQNLSDILNDTIYIIGIVIMALMQNIEFKQKIPSEVLIYLLISNCMIL